MAWTFTEEKYNTLLERITALEEHHNNIAIALDKVVTLDQVHDLMVLFQGDLDNIKEVVMETFNISLDIEPTVIN